MKYIGQHHYSGKGIDPNYLGSGKYLQEAIIKYGKSNFTCKILCRCNSAQELDIKEMYYIDLYNAVDSPEFYNLVPGGTGQRPGFQFSEETKRKLVEHHSNRTRIHKGDVGKLVKTCDLQRYLDDGWELGYSKAVKGRLNCGRMPGKLNPMYGKKHSEETRRKISEALSGRTAHNKGIPNKYAQGTRWITNITTLQHRMVSKQVAEDLVSSGNWRFGRN